jgi:hypothetical protein
MADRSGPGERVATGSVGAWRRPRIPWPNGSAVRGRSRPTGPPQGLLTCLTSTSVPPPGDPPSNRPESVRGANCRRGHSSVHLAALLHQFRSQRAVLGQRFVRVNVEGTRIRCSGLRSTKASRVLVYVQQHCGLNGPVGTRGRREFTPTRIPLYGRRNSPPYGYVLRGGRERTSGFGTVLCRYGLSAVYGARIKGNYRRLGVLRSARRPLPVLWGRQRIRRTNRSTIVTFPTGHPSWPQVIPNRRLPPRSSHVSDGDRCISGRANVVTGDSSALGRAPPPVVSAVRYRKRAGAPRPPRAMRGCFWLTGPQGPPFSRALLEQVPRGPTAVDGEPHFRRRS